MIGPMPPLMVGITWRGLLTSLAIGLVVIGGIVALLFTSGCATQPPKQITRYETVEVPKYIRAPIPAQYLNDCSVNEPAPACGKLYCNGQVAIMIDDYRGALRQCNADKAALRSLQPQEK